MRVFSKDPFIRAPIYTLLRNKYSCESPLNPTNLPNRQTSNLCTADPAQPLLSPHTLNQQKHLLNPNAPRGGPSGAALLQSEKLKYAAKHQLLPPRKGYLESHTHYPKESIGNDRGVFKFLGL